MGRAAAFGDIDNDGDTDVLVTNNTGPVRLWLNQAGGRASWLQVRLDNGSANRLGLGALVHVEHPGARPLVGRVRTDGSYLSAHDPTSHFGLGEWRGPVTVRVDWPGGPSEQWTLPKASQRVTLARGSGATASRAPEFKNRKVNAGRCHRAWFAVTIGRAAVRPAARS